MRHASPYLSSILCLISATANAEPSATSLPYLRAVLAEDLLEFAEIEVPSKANIAIIDEGMRDYLELRLIPGQQFINGGVRAEISINYPFEEGDTLTYQWRLKIAQDLQADPDNQWWIMGQWHDQPDEDNGETWALFPSNSPSISLGYGRLFGIDTLALSYGVPDQQIVARQGVARGEWIDIRAEIHWSTKSDGWARVYLNNATSPFANVTGANMHNAYGHYLKLGMYRHPLIQTNARIWIDDVTIAPITP